MHTPEVSPVQSDDAFAITADSTQVGFISATVTWPRKNDSDPTEANGGAPSGSSTPAPKGFELQDIDARFPLGELSLICGSLGAGKTLMLLGERACRSTVYPAML